MKEAPKDTKTTPKDFLGPKILVMDLKEFQLPEIEVSKGELIVPKGPEDMEETATFLLNRFPGKAEGPEPSFLSVGPLRKEQPKAEKPVLQKPTAVKERGGPHMPLTELRMEGTANLPVPEGYVFNKPEIFVVAPLSAAVESPPLAVGANEALLRAKHGKVRLPAEAVMFVPESLELPSALHSEVLKGRVVPYTVGDTLQQTLKKTREEGNVVVPAWLEKAAPVLAVNADSPLKDKTAVAQLTQEERFSLMASLIPLAAAQGPKPLNEIEQQQVQKILDGYKNGKAPLTAAAAVLASRTPLKHVDHSAPVKAGFPKEQPKPQVRAADGYKQKNPEELYKKVGTLPEWCLFKPNPGTEEVYCLTRAELFETGMKGLIPPDGQIWYPKGGGIENNKWYSYGGTDGVGEIKQTIDEVRDMVGPQGLEMYDALHHKPSYTSLKAPLEPAEQTAAPVTGAAADTYHQHHGKKAGPEPTA